MSGDDNPFSKLAALRESLPAGPAPTTSTGAAKPARPMFLDKVVVRMERKGHGGKTVTVVSGVAPFALEGLCGDMKKALGVGARVEDGAIVLQGDLVPRAMAYLDKRGAGKVINGSAKAPR
ncbi:MAG TPA: translation initiation factor [Myxococcota bacterium]